MTLMQINQKLLNLRVLLSRKNTLSPVAADFYYIQTWSDFIFLNYLIKTEGLGVFIQKAALAYFTMWRNQLLGKSVYPLPVVNYPDVMVAVEKFYLRQSLFGTHMSVVALARFTQALDQNPALTIGASEIYFKAQRGLFSQDEKYAALLVAEATVENRQPLLRATTTMPYPLFSPIGHYAGAHKTILSTYAHPFHLVDPSPWPFCTAISLWYLAFTTVAFFHNYLQSVFNIIFGLVYLGLTLAFWWRDVIRESTYEYKHTPYVRRGLLTGMLLFIISEIMFFFGFFWAFFHASLAPSAMLGGVWPPVMIDVISPWQLPLVNTLCLLLSGVTLTIAHRQLNGLPYYNQTVSVQWPLVRRLILWLQVTVFLGTFFLSCQALEYYLSPFTFQDTVFGGTFYILTGLHGLHVLVGTVFLVVCLWRASRLHFTLWKQVGFKAAVWYWHFVDVVWIFLFIVIYIWGGFSL